MSLLPIDQNVIDDEQFDEMRDLLEDEFDTLVQAYLTDSQLRLQLLHSAFQAEDNNQGFETAHALKGASTNLGATQLSHLCHELQEVCRNQTLNQASALIERIGTELTAVQKEITRRLGQ